MSDFKERNLPVFLGITEHAARRGLGWNLIGLTSDLIFPFFPQTLSGLHIVLGFPSGFFERSKQLSYRILLTDEQNPSETAKSAHDLVPQEAESESAPRTGASPPSSEQAASDKGATMHLIPTYRGGGKRIKVVPFPAPDLTLREPTTISVDFEVNDRSYQIGTANCVHTVPQPLDDEERRAIKSRPNAPGLVSLGVSCNECQDDTRYYDTLEPTKEPPSELEDAVRISDAPDSWECNCGRVQIPLMYAKQGMHDLFRQIRPKGDEQREVVQSYIPLHQSDRIEGVVARYEDLIEGEPGEEAVQKYLENHPVFWSFLSPQRIIHKPPILTKKNADFGILSSQSIFYLVEIEKPRTKLITKGGKVSEEIQKGARQIRDWEMVVSEKRMALLSELDLDDTDVYDIRYLLIGGLVSRVDSDGLTKLRRSAFPKEVQFFGFDELASFLHTLRWELRSV